MCYGTYCLLRGSYGRVAVGETRWFVRRSSERFRQLQNTGSSQVTNTILLNITNSFDNHMLYVGKNMMFENVKEQM